MGGERETVLERSKAKKPSKQTVAVGKIRVHETDSGVHFHDDANKLKVVVPPADWMVEWGKLASGLKKKTSFTDPSNGTRLTIRVSRNKKTNEIEAETEIEKVSFGSEFQKLQKFATG